MGFKNEMKQVMKNVLKDVEKEADKVWKTTYEGHTIEIHNQFKEEILFINGEVVDRKKRNSLLSYARPYSTLRGILRNDVGEEQTVTAKVGGLLKFNCVIKVDGKTVYSVSEAFEMLPWKNKEAIVPFLLEQIEEHGHLVTEELPDDAYVYDENHPRMTPGLADELVDDIPTPFFVKKLMKRLAAQIENPNDKTRLKLYDEVNMDRIPNYLDAFIDLYEETNLPEEGVQAEAVWLLENAPDREVVKFAIVLLGLTDCEPYRSTLLKIGQHEEFTKYVVYALDDHSKEGNMAIFELAQKVNGWGKIAAVDRLIGISDEVRTWLLSEGYKNKVADGYNAFDCVVEGRLDWALEADDISKELYYHAGKLIGYLVRHEAATGSLDDFPNTPKMLLHFVKHAEKHCHKLADFYPVALIDQYLQADIDTWRERNQAYWTEEEQKALRQAIKPFVEDRKWLSMAVDTLDEMFDEEALLVANYFGLNVTGKLFGHLQEQPTNQVLYQAIVNSDIERDMVELVQFATRRFNFEALLPEEEACVLIVLMELYRYEGVGLELIHRALQSDYEVLQHEAMMALMHWETASWKYKKTQEILNSVMKNSSSKENRQVAKQLLKE